MVQQDGKEDSAASRIQRICQEMQHSTPTREQVQELIWALDAFLVEIEEDRK